LFRFFNLKPKFFYSLSIGYRGAECKPVIPPPTEHAPNRTQSKHAEKSIAWMEFGLLEFD
jgi:hypothetical protein